MNRRKFIKGASVAGGATAIAASTFPAPAFAQKRIEITMVATWGRDFPGLGTGAQRFAKRLSDMTDGRMNVKYYAANERVKAFDSFDEVASGNAQMYHAADYYWKGKHPGWAYFTAVPFGFVFSEINSWINFGGGQELWDELAGSFGLKCLACGNTGVQMGGWFRNQLCRRPEGAQNEDSWFGRRRYGKARCLSCLTSRRANIRGPDFRSNRCHRVGWSLE